MALKALLRRVSAILLGVTAVASAQAAEPTADFSARAGELVALFNGTARPKTMFTPAFLADVPEDRLAAIAKQVTAQLGVARAVDRIDAKSPNMGVVMLAFARGTATIDLVIEAAAPHRIEGLLITGSEVTNDSFATILDELAGLPADTSLSVARLSDGAPAPVATHHAERPMAIGSSFKLFVLAELVRAIGAGERRWDDAAPLTHRSLPSGFLQAWPRGSPLTLHTLAALMISQSDNSAAATLHHLLGREKVEALLPALGVRAAERNRPFLSTLEAFALKAGDEAPRQAWIEGDEGKRRALLSSLAEIDPADIDIARFAGDPLAIDSAEWFASTDDLVRTMDWLRRHGDERALALLAINPGIGGARAEAFDYLGYKGGSEAGVVNMTFLLRNEAGGWYAVSGSWNDPAARLAEARFAMLMSRAVALLR